jgi:hypothetical protein
MHVRITTGILLLTLTAFAADKVQRLNVKTGLWEVTTTIHNQGHMPVPAAMLERMTPEQRVRMEERLKAQPADRSRTITHKNCVTEQDMQKGDMFSTNPNKECTEHVVSSTSTSAEIQMSCKGEGIQGNGTIKIKVLNPESVTGSSHITATGNGQTLNTDSTFTSKWLSASCGNTH